VFVVAVVATALEVDRRNAGPRDEQGSRYSLGADTKHVEHMRIWYQAYLVTDLPLGLCVVFSFIRLRLAGGDLAIFPPLQQAVLGQIIV
jgi:hypothetical protein